MDNFLWLAAYVLFLPFCLLVIALDELDRA